MTVDEFRKVFATLFTAAGPRRCSDQRDLARWFMGFAMACRAALPAVPK